MASQSEKPASSVERVMEGVIFRSRWLLAPFYLGLVLALVVLLVRFWIEVIHLVSTMSSGEEGKPTILGILNLIDLSLLANLILIVIFSGYESFVSHIESNVGERPAWMGKIDFSGLKVKLMGSLAAISGIYLLEALLNLHAQSSTNLIWKLAIHFTFVLSGVLFALTERIESPSGEEASGHGNKL